MLLHISLHQTNIPFSWSPQVGHREQLEASLSSIQLSLSATVAAEVTSSDMTPLQLQEVGLAGHTLPSTGGNVAMVK